MAKKRLEILTDVDRTAINKRIDDISTEYVFGFEETFVATANQVEFTLSKEFDKGMQAVDLYINGVKQPSSFFTEVNNKTIKTKKPIAQGDIVNIKAYKSKKTTEVKVIEHKDSHISGNDQLPVATEDTKGLMAPEDKKKIKAIDMKADSALKKIAEHDTEIDNLKQSVSDGKKKVSVAITDKGVETAPDATFDVMATNISKIETDPSIGTTTANASDILDGKKAVSKGELITGTMANNGVLSKTITTQGGTQKISPGYYDGGEVKAQFNNLTPENIKKGINIGGTIGTHDIYASHDTLAKSIDISEAYKGLPGVIYFGGSNYISSGSWHTLSKKIKIDAKAEIIPVRFGIEGFAESGASSTKHFNAQLLDESGSIIASVNNNVNSAYSGTVVMSSTVKLIPGMTYTARAKNENKYDRCRFLPFVMFSFNNEAESFVSVF